MTNHPCFRFFCGILIGLAAGSAMAMGTAQAADIGAPVLDNGRAAAVAAQPQPAAPATAPATASTKDRSPGPSGPQGPIRTESQLPPAAADQDTVRRDLQTGRYPMANGASIP